jgi:exosortase/archaeosortase family protein
MKNNFFLFFKNFFKEFLRGLNNRKIIIREISKNKNVLKFSLLFFFFSSFFYLLLVYFPLNTTFLEYIEAKSVQLIFDEKITFMNSFYSDNKAISLYFFKNNTHYYFIIDKECTSLNVFFPLLAFILSFPPSLDFLKLRLLFIVFSFVFLETMNIIRLILLFYFFKYYYSLYDLFHNLIWQITNLLLILFMIFLYLRLLNFIKRKK